MRNISATSLNKIVQTEGSDPITLIQIYWTEQTYIIYGDRAFTPQVKGGLLEIGEIENVINASKGSNSGSVAVRLDDIDGHLKNIFDENDIHKRPVYVLQWFADIPLKEAFVVFDGVISTPIIWNEGDRTLSFDILSKIEDLEIGFSAEEGNFDYIPPNIIGQAWPFIFGTALHVPALLMNEIPSGTTEEDTGIDGMGEGQIGPLANIADQERKNITLLQELERQCFTMAAILLGNAYLIDSTEVTSQASQDVGLSGGGTTVTEDLGDANFPMHGIGLSGAFYRKSDNPTAQQLYDVGTQYEELGNQYLRERMRPININAFQRDDYKALEKNQLKITGGGRFPQKQNVIIRINGAVHEGYFEGDIFTIVSRTFPYTDQAAVVAPTEVLDRAVATEYLTTMAAQSFFYAVGGSGVNVDINHYPVYYIVGIPHVTVGAVLAKKETGITKFVVPSSYYSVIYKTFGALKATILVMSRPLSSRAGENWADEIWCNLTSPIGPNGVDIIEYLVEHYTNQSIDTVSFAATRPLINPYKMGFALLDRASAMQVIGDLAYMLRCAIWFKGGRFYIKYLAKADTPVDTITEDDVESGTMQVQATDTEDLVTKWSVEWAPNVSKTPKNKIVYRYHVKKYGLIEDGFDCYAFNNIELVKKFAIFWLIRKANTWKRLVFSSFLTKIRLEPFDTVLINFASDYVNDPGCVQPTLAVVEEARYNSDSQRVELVIWLPIRFGEMCPYDFAYPGDLDITYVFPQENDSGIETGIPGNLEEGELYDQEPHVGAGQPPNTTPPNSGFGGGALITDSADQQHSDAGHFDPSTEIDPSVIYNSAGVSGTAAPPTNNKVSTRTIKPITVNKPVIVNSTYPGFVVKQSGDRYDKYEVDIYQQGLSGKPKRVVAVQLDIDIEDMLDEGTPCMVTMNPILDKEGLVANVEYIMQVPIWLKPIASTNADGSSSVTKPPDVPVADEGTQPAGPDIAGAIPGEGDE